MKFCADFSRLKPLPTNVRHPEGNCNQPRPPTPFLQIEILKVARGVCGSGGGLLCRGQVQPEAQQPEFTDSQLQSFVDIQGDLEVIRTEYGARLEETDDPEVAQALQEEASQEMVAAVEPRNLEMEIYNEIARTLQQDPELLARVQEMIQQE